MAKLSAHGTELFRYFSTASRSLKSVRSDGTTLVKYPGGNWKLRSRKKPDVTLEAWIEAKTQFYNSLPEWQASCKSLPSLGELERWSMDATCETVDGKEYLEPDFRGNGVIGPSWLVALGYI